MTDLRCSDNDVSKRDIPSFIEPRPPLITHPFMRPKPQKGTNLLELFEEDSECEEPELVQVYLRLKPCNTPSNLYEVRSDRYLITSLDTTTAGHGRRTQHNVSKMYTFSHIFGTESGQREIFETVVKDNLKKLPDGHSFTLLTYGASGSGKTFTLMGTVASPGLVPRSLEYVFKVVDASQQPLYKPAEAGADELNIAEQDYELQWVKRLRQVSAPLRDKYRRMSVQLRNNLTSSNLDLTNRTRHYVWVSFIEIYNEGIYDLLVNSDRRSASKLAIREDSSGNAYVKGATQAFVRSGEEAYDVMVAGKHNLQVAATGVHAQSSRSHCIFTITMLTETESGVRGSCVRLCDLAGCERAARTLNTGARMQESRAINTSLHVLERCLHTLRRRQTQRRRALVPYRESKLTRLLGAGLLGARGEAVSMVVTLNPAPQYAHETRHVLQLAAVARDIQVNNTISEYPSSLESSRTTDTTIAPSNEVMKLRADNELLHFELIQAQARVRELAASMEEQQASAADTMRELVEEARAITKQYYETQMRVLRDEMEEMIDEYESRLSNVAQPSSDSPSKAMQNQINQLLMDIAILEEKLSAEQLARARAEEEVQHLRACIEERDEKEANIHDVISVTESDDSEDESDFNDESLEPRFTKEDINRSRQIRKSMAAEQNSINSEHSIVNDSLLEKSSDTLQGTDKTNNSTDNDCSFNTGEDVSEVSSKPDNSNDDDISHVETLADIISNTIHTLSESCKSKTLSRQTYNVANIEDVSTFFDCSRELTFESHNSLPSETISTVKKNYFAKKHGSVDMFEGSPLIVKDVNLENIRKSMNELVIFDANSNNVELLESNTVELLKSNKKQIDQYENAKTDANMPLEINDKSKENSPSHQHLDGVQLLHTEAVIDNEINESSPQHISNVASSNISDRCVVEAEMFKKTDEPEKDQPSATIRKNESQLEVTSPKVDNTLTEFEQIYKDVTAPRATEFDLLITQDESQIEIKNHNDQTMETEEVQYNLRRKLKSERKKNDTCFNLESTNHNDQTMETEEVQYNLRRKLKSERKKDDTCFKSASTIKPTERNLRLRRRKNLFDEETVDTGKEEKLKDIVNLQSEFSDVLLDIPAPEKIVKDIPSPEKQEEEENVPPIYGIQSCPSKSIQRSRRKLFTPRAEPLDDSVSPRSNSNTKISVPRPSYHRPRARRKL